MEQSLGVMEERESDESVLDSLAFCRNLSSQLCSQKLGRTKSMFTSEEIEALSCRSGKVFFRAAISR